MCVKLAVEDMFWFETMAEKAGVIYDVRNQPDGVTRYAFDEDFLPAVKAILQIPPERRPKKQSSLDARINNARGRSQISNSPLTKEAAVAAQVGLQPKPPIETQLQESADPPAPPSTIENDWAEAKMAEELQAIKETETLLASSQEPAAETASKPRKKRKSLGRRNQIKTRLTDAELVQFQRRVKTSGLAQGDYLRSVALTGNIVIEDYSVADVAMLDELAMIRADLGRQGGLLKMILKPNEGRRKLAPKEWAELIGAIRDMEQLKNRLSDLEVKVQRGNH